MNSNFPTQVSPSLVSQMSRASKPAAVTGEYTTLDNEDYFRIGNSHRMPEFFMSLIGASDHWMFTSSTGALSAGRCDPDSSLFPYRADDQILQAQATTGPVTLIRSSSPDKSKAGNHLWEPFASHPPETEPIVRNVYKTPLGNKVVFEETHTSLQLSFRYRWAFSERFGFVRSCTLTNLANEPLSLDLLDGFQGILPYGVGSEFVMRFSNLANAYKKSERLETSNVGLFYLSSIPTDRAEPSEGLKATTVWQTGLKAAAYLLSTEQFVKFRQGDDIQSETDIRGKEGAYGVQESLTLPARESLKWHVVAELNQDHAAVVRLDHWVQTTENPSAELEADIEASQRALLRIASSSDALQCTANLRRTNRHLANTLFNLMRGGVPLDSYTVRTDDFRQHVKRFNKTVAENHQSLLQSLPAALSASELKTSIQAANDPDLTRQALEYLPLAFSRRHGDPTRPWNRFAIKLRTDTGQTNLNYQGNWRDIFQNWEALAASFPNFTTAMVCRFLNATTADGYNPYRLTKDGFEWEEPAPNDPWSNIGYWGDHQIVYLLKLLEACHRTHPADLDDLVNSPVFVHANVPYRIKAFEEILDAPQSTILFDQELADKIARRVEALGADGKLLPNQSGEIQHVTLVEKLLTLSLAKLSNFVPDGGIWLNTQRPEWNDANNALVGQGLSMVTTCYLFRWFRFLHQWLSKVSQETFLISSELHTFFTELSEILRSHEPPQNQLTPAPERKRITEALSRSGSAYRARLYGSAPTGQTTDLAREDCTRFIETVCHHLESTIRNNRRADGLFHTYNLLDWKEEALDVEYLYEMLEGQVAVLSAGLLSPSEAVVLLNRLRQSPLYRSDQNSYLLYPNRQLKRFIEKNNLPESHVDGCPLLKSLLDAGNQEIVQRDIHGQIHFNGSFRNAGDLKAALERLPEDYEAMVQSDSPQLVSLFENIFDHRQFTGRSGTFFAYEGLGSIYWHMVSKLGLAVAENFFVAIDANETAETIDALRQHYRSIQQGIGAEKSPNEYGAFPTDPYSHTPENAGVKQPGMTGQVKEDILARFMELGPHVEDACIRFRPELLDRNEFVSEPTEFRFYNVSGTLQSVEVPKDSLGFTVCQVPVIVHSGERNLIRVQSSSNESLEIDGLRLDPQTSQALFSRSGKIHAITVEIVAANPSATGTLNHA